MTTDPNDGSAVKDLQQLVDRYLALWNEPDLGASRSRLLDNVVSLNWTLASRADGTKAGSGVNVLALGGDGRIRIDYQFVET